MLNLKKKLSDLAIRAKSLKSGLSHKKATAAVLTAALTLGAYNTVSADSMKLTTVYYVYLNDTYIGTVTNKEIVKQIIAEKQEKLASSYKDIDIALGSQVKYIPEQVFRSTANNSEAVENLEKELQPQADASAIVLDGKPVVYLADKQTADDVLKKLKMKYVTEAQLNEIETQKSVSQNALPPLKENESRILDVRLSKNASVEDVRIAPGKVLTAEQALTFLQKGTLEDRKYKVKDGDVLGSIANDHQLSLADMLAINPGLNEDSVLKPEQEVNITVTVPLLEVIVDKEVSQKEIIPFKNEYINDSSLPKGEKKVKQAGENGNRLATYTVSEQNGKAIKKILTKQEVLVQPVKHIVIKGTKVIPSRGEGSFSWPAVGGYISSQMGYRDGKLHKGIDIARPSSYTIKAADNGIVVSAGWDGGYGNKIVIDHQNGFQTVYGHLSSIRVSPGETVGKGSAIGVMGSTGDSTGVHLHFEVYKNGSLKNPLSYIGR
ncbi:peptidoglycan DD-metalloendopeptidase family protein [Neobacillus sp. PS3-34]|uniref:peptidoglycan DD-metalloendopeptidase family protein n=1 Tax=Neobacillus sp. PS3-34 TaxID=3070678 RepID=UPI0027E06CD7|nr:peptidoglycan DD-metalloendopeptidase family protein [Neobacillus sp. PS3-34]WML50383.1 peptidoglycan DD-metalloendopeptidase family protein [Neobacillus sp. PS3-34]